MSRGAPAGANSNASGGGAGASPCRGAAFSSSACPPAAGKFPVTTPAAPPPGSAARLAAPLAEPPVEAAAVLESRVAGPLHQSRRGAALAKARSPARKVRARTRAVAGESGVGGSGCWLGHCSSLLSVCEESSRDDEDCGIPVGF